MSRFWLVAMLAAAWTLTGCGKGDKPQNELKVYCAAGLREPIEEIVAGFKAERPGLVVSLDYAASNHLLGKLRIASAPEDRPDIYISGEESYAEEAAGLGLVDRQETMAYFLPVLAVPANNPRNITKLEDLDQPGVKLVLGEARGPAIGMVSEKLLRQAGLEKVWEKADKFATVNEVATVVMLGHADAGIIWDTLARQHNYRDKVRAFPIPGAPPSRIVVCRVAQCPSPALADEFIRTLTTTESARAILRKYDFQVTTQADRPASQPNQPSPPARGSQ